MSQTYMVSKETKLKETENYCYKSLERPNENGICLEKYYISYYWLAYFNTWYMDKARNVTMVSFYRTV